MKKYILTLVLGLICAVGFAQDYVVVNQGAVQHKYLLKEVNAINHTFDGVTIVQGDRMDSYNVADVDSITFVKALDTTIPQDLLDELDDYMPIYYGDTPPNIEGIYLEHVVTLVYSSYGFSPGDTFVDHYLKFFNQDMVNNVLDYEATEYQNGWMYAYDYSTESYIMGNNNDFTVYFNIVGTNYYDENYVPVDVKQAIVISGTKGEHGISNLYYSFVMVDKSDDPYPHYVPVGTIRVFHDGDGWSPVTTWPINNTFNATKPAADSNLKSTNSMPE